MKNYLEWEERLKNSQSELNQDEIKEIKKIYQYHAKKFIQIINNINSKIKSISETKQFFFLLDTFKDEIVDVSPFLSTRSEILLVAILFTSSALIRYKSTNAFSSCRF